MVLTFLTLVYLALLLFKAGSSGWAIRQQAREAAPAVPDFSSVSILQPILGGDPLLREQLAWNVRRLPQVEFLWLVDADDALALAATEAIGEEFPAANIQILRCPPAPDGVNPKSFKLESAWRRAKGSTCVVLDDDSKLVPETLAKLVNKANADTLVTALPYYEDQGDFASKLLAAFVNNNSALTYLPLLPWHAPITINGMCYAMNKGLLARIGGYQTILRHLADDLALATRLLSCHGRIEQIFQPVAVQTSLTGLTHYVRQAHRWFLFATLLLAEQGQAWKTLIGLLHGLPPLLLWGVVLLAIAQPDATAVVLVGVLLLVRGLVLSQLQRLTTGQSRHAPLLSVLSELLQPLHLGHALLARTIIWRSRRLRVYSNERFKSV